MGPVAGWGPSCKWHGEGMPLTYAFRLAPGPQALDQAILAEKLGYKRVWSPEVPAFGHDIWVISPALPSARSASVLVRRCSSRATAIRWHKHPPSPRSSTSRRAA